jgi:FMN-dependent oxidoreductase (nitrilotriacetate monooxygenase family)
MNDCEALNFGIDAHLDHDQRYDRADEFVELTYKFWRSWEADALVLDKARGIYANPGRVHYVNHAGRWFRARGPLNIPHMPQTRPVIIQAGSSGRGKAFAARWADVIFTIQQTQEQTKRFYDDVKAQLPGFGRRREDCKILTAIMPFVAGTRTEAERKRDEHNALIHPLVGLSTLSSHSNVDFSTRRPEEPIAHVQATGTQGLFAAVMRLTHEQGLTLADIGTLYGRSVLVPQIAGTAAEIADFMQAILEAEASDGFVISPAFLPDSFEEFVDQVVPELQRREIFRKEYTGRRLRDHLALAIP